MESFLALEMRVRERQRELERSARQAAVVRQALHGAPRRSLRWWLTQRMMPRRRRVNQPVPALPRA